MGGSWEQVDRVAGRIYARVLAVVLYAAAAAVTVSGFLFIRAGGTLFGLFWLAGGLAFGLLGRRLWRSRATLRETFDGHS